MREMSVTGHTARSTLASEDLRGFLWDVAATALTRGAGVVTGVVTLTATTRLLGPEGRGQFAVAMACLGLILQFTHLGLHASSTYHLSREPESRRPVTALLLWYAFGAVGAIAVAAAVMVYSLPSLVPNVPPRIVTLALATAPPAMFVMLAGSAWLGLGRPALFNGLDLAGKAAGLVAVIVLVWWAVPAFFVVYAILHYGIALWAYVSLAGWTRPVVDSAVSRQVISFGSKMFLINVFMFLLLRLDLFLVNAWLGSGAAGQYSVAVQVSELLLLATASVTAMLFPRLAAMAPESRWRATWRAVRWLAVGLGLAAVALAATGGPVFTLAFGPSFAAAVTPFWLLLPGLWCLGLNGILLQHLAADGMPWFPAGATAGVVVANLFMNSMLIPRYGIAGAALTSSLSYAFLLSLSVAYVLRRGVRAHPLPAADARAL